jgi:hypothetical protein
MAAKGMIVKSSFAEASSYAEASEDKMEDRRGDLVKNEESRRTAAGQPYRNLRIRPFLRR